MRLLIALLAAGCAMAQSRTTVAQSGMIDAKGALMGGTFNVRAMAPFQAPDGSWVDTGWARVSVVNGRFSVPLWPGTYTAEWHLMNQPSRTDLWVVPASVTAVGLSAVVAGTAPASPAGIQPGQVLASGVPDGWCFRSSGGVGVWQSCPAGGSGGSGALSWAAMTSAQWSAMTSAQWSAITQ